MTLDDYQREAMRTRVRAPGESVDSALDTAIMALGLAGEAGEVADMIKKMLGHGHAISSHQVRDELGDVLWYVAAVAREFNLSLSDVAEANVEKLLRRYPDGFTHAASVNR